ncbi:hypothetical protein HHI36_007360, partial [Cryptolaemus montrouzieri]
RWKTPANVDECKNEIDNTLEYNENMSVNILFQNIMNTILNAKGKHCHKPNQDQKLNQRIKLLERKRREMSDKTAEEYRSISREIAKEIRKFRKEKNQKEIKTVIENNKSLKVLRRRTEIKRGQK